MGTEQLERVVHDDRAAKGGKELSEDVAVGRNGVAVRIRKGASSGEAGGYRTYEIHQRMRVQESTEKIQPMSLISPEFAANPYPTLETLRENYPCYRDWIGNSYWITRYDDVTSIFQDDANYETRPKLWFYDMEDYGRDLRQELPVLFAHAEGIDNNVEGVAAKVLTDIAGKGEADLALDFAARIPMELWARVLDLPEADFDKFVHLYWRMQRGYHWEPETQRDGREAIREMTALLKPLFDKRKSDPGEDMISAIATMEVEGKPTTVEDVVVTVLEHDHETLHGGLANMLYLLLEHPDQLHWVNDERRMVRYAWAEMLRHSTPVLQAYRFAKHEVERFGRLLPEGAMLVCSAAAGNRDPRVYNDPDKFIVGRKDLCQREPRGHYRADGLPAGIAFGLGQPSKFPALPEDRPRSLYAITRDTAVTVTNMLLDSLPNLRMKQEAEPSLRSLRVGEMHTCWHLPVKFDAK
ncbi:MAG: hypothetical protein R3360_00760 [Alphaproteobacteria bacterium]|nr:hypothetical protein [Alphaproteobacteria bacterium]